MWISLILLCLVCSGCPVVRLSHCCCLVPSQAVLPLANFLPNFHISTTRRILSSVANRKCQGHEARIKRNYEGEGMQPREKQKDPKRLQRTGKK